jgi:hypothetical protein
MEYALLINNQFQEIRSFDKRPVDIEHKGIRWLPVVRNVGDEASGEYGGEWVVFTPRPVPTSQDVNAERDRRTAAGIPFLGHVFDFDQMGKDNITGAATLAKFAILKGAQPGDYRWANPNVDFSWIVQSNEKILMDAHQVSALGDVAAGWTTAHIFAARAIKDKSPIPLDYADDKYWPARS